MYSKGLLGCSGQLLGSKKHLQSNLTGVNCVNLTFCLLQSDWTVKSHINKCCHVSYLLWCRWSLNQILQVSVLRENQIDRQREIGCKRDRVYWEKISMKWTPIQTVEVREISRRGIYTKNNSRQGLFH